MSKITENFGSMVFSDTVMQQRLPRETYKALQNAIRFGRPLTPEAADVVANAMKDWALDVGATHFTHWFQPMTGITAEKHESFLTLRDGKPIVEFSGKELIHGEPDASSFPSGGLRATFEARGYTAWDPTSYAFVKDGVLCVPTAFCSYGGEALDKKTPLLRSMEAVNRQALRILRLFGDEGTQRVNATVGAEQEYFLIDKTAYEKRQDLIYTGRTLFGQRPPKGQELDDHYFGAVKPRVAAFMRELNEELWKLGVYAKTEHNETAPAQHELAPVFSTVNLATDQNQLTMELMKRIADRHGMVCLLHEKPFAGINGSGKHNNWSLSTDKGENLLEPGETPARNARFLTFLCAVIQAVDEYPDLLRAAAASAGNDHRLGAHEAPPAVVSIFLGQELTAVLDSIESGREYAGEERQQFKVGVDVLPRFPKDSTDRNRTSPFAFTGNKFEFRMVGSSASIAEANVVLNTIVSDVLDRYAQRLEGAGENFKTRLNELLTETLRRHKRVLFNGNGYDPAWLREAESRGLMNLPTTVDSALRLIDRRNVELFRRCGVYSETELRSRCDIMLDGYCKVLKIEALTMSQMVRKDILPAVSRFTSALIRQHQEKANFFLAADYEAETATRLGELSAEAYESLQQMEKAVKDAEGLDTMHRSQRYQHNVLPAMTALRRAVDEMESLTEQDCWPYPSIGEIIFSVK
ncbi:MAG: glutamine synthetase III [Oscillospiraceae bacterium]|nr:glutamine synthetase III [Oscillospiraceae bacterium]